MLENTRNLPYCLFFGEDAEGKTTQITMGRADGKLMDEADRDKMFAQLTRLVVTMNNPKAEGHGSILWEDGSEEEAVLARQLPTEQGEES